MERRYHRCGGAEPPEPQRDAGSRRSTDTVARLTAASLHATGRLSPAR